MFSSWCLGGLLGRSITKARAERRRCPTLCTSSLPAAESSSTMHWSALRNSWWRWCAIFQPAESLILRQVHVRLKPLIGHEQTPKTDLLKPLGAAARAAEHEGGGGRGQRLPAALCLLAGEFFFAARRRRATPPTPPESSARPELLRCIGMLATKATKWVKLIDKNAFSHDVVQQRLP